MNVMTGHTPGGHAARRAATSAAGIAPRLAGRLLVALLPIGFGCNSDQAKKNADYENRIDTLTRQVKEQSKDLLEKEDKLRQQQSQLQMLTALGGDRRYDFLNKPVRMDIEERSSGFDTDGKPGHDEVRAYVRIYDDDGDIVKALGVVQLQVLDLANPQAHYLICEQKWTPEELRKCWYGRFGFQHFRLVGKWNKTSAPRHPGLTVRVVFADVLTGRRFEAQRLITIQLPPD